MVSEHYRNKMSYLSIAPNKYHFELCLIPIPRTFKHKRGMNLVQLIHFVENRRSFVSLRK